MPGKNLGVTKVRTVTVGRRRRTMGMDKIDYDLLVYLIKIYFVFVGLLMMVVILMPVGQ